MKKDILKVFMMGKNNVHASILHFADDTLLFCKDDGKMLNAFINIIELFVWCSGQKVNWEKSALCGINIDEDKLLYTALKLNCKIGSLPFLYLELPLSGYPKKVSFWQRIIDRIHKNLDHWKCFNLSRGGRLTLNKAVPSNLPTY